VIKLHRTCSNSVATKSPGST